MKNIKQIIYYKIKLLLIVKIVSGNGNRDMTRKWTAGRRKGVEYPETPPEDDDDINIAFVPSYP